MAVDQLDPLVVPVVTDMQRFQREMDNMEREGRRASRAVGESMSEGVAQTERLTVSAEAAGNTLKGVALIAASRVADGFRGALGWITRTTAGLIDLGALGALSVARGVDQMAESTRDANGELSTMGRVGKVASGGLEAVAKTAIAVSGVLTGMQVATAAVAAGLFVLAHRANAAFGPTWNRVLVSVGHGGREMSALRNEVSLLAGQLGVEGPEAADTFYEIIGAMPQLLDKPREALDILRVSLEAGSTGFTNAAEAAKATAAILTAFSLEANQARRVSDALFTAQGLGATTYGEIASSIGNVSGLTAALNGEFEDLLGILATLTPTGTSTSEIVTQIGGAISNIIKPSEDAKAAAAELGIEFNAAALEAKGLNGFLTEMVEVSDGNPEILARLFGGRQALALMVSLVGKTEELDRWTNEIRTSSGATADAVDQMNDSWERQKEILDARFDASLRALGAQFEDLGVTGLEAVNGLLGALNELDAKLAGGPTEFGQQWGEATRAFFERRTAEIRSWFATMFPAGPQLDRIPTLPGATNRAPRAVFGSTPAAFSAIPNAPAIARPDEPTSLEYSTQKIREYGAELQALNILELARTRNMEAFEQSTREAEDAVNRMVLEEAERLRAAGAESSVVNELLGMYRAVSERAEGAARVVEAAIQRRTSAAEREIAMLRREAEAAEAIGRVDLAEKWAREADQLERLNEWAQAFTPSVVEGMERAAGAVGPALGALAAAFEDRLAELREQFARELISREEFERLGGEAAEAFNRGVLAKIEALRDAGQLTQREYRELTALLKGLGSSDGAKKASTDVARLAREYGNVARAVVSVVGSMGEMDDAIRRSIEGSILLIENLVTLGDQVRDAVEKAATATAEAQKRDPDASPVAAVLDVAALGSAIGAIGGLASVISTLVGASDREREAMLRSMESMRSLTDAIHQLRGAVLTDISVAEQERIEAAGAGFERRFGALLEWMQGRGFGGTPLTVSGLSQDDFDFLRDLEELTGIEFFDEKTGKIVADRWEAAWAAFQDMDVGAFANDLLGRLDALDYAASVAGGALGTATEQMQLFIDTVRGFSPGFAAEFERILKEEGPAAARAWLEQQAVLFAQPGGAANLGSWASGLTPEQIRRIIEEGVQYTDQLTGGVTGGGAAETRLGVSITEVQGSQMLTLLSTSNYHLAGMHALMRSAAGLPATIPAVDPAAFAPARSGGTTILIETVDVDVTAATGSPTDRDAWSQAGRDIAAGIRDGLGAGEIVDVIQGAGRDRPRPQM